MLESESLYLMQWPNRAEPLIRKGLARSMNWEGIFHQEEALFSSSFGASCLQVLCSSDGVSSPWSWLEQRRSTLDWEPSDSIDLNRFAEQVDWVKMGIQRGDFEKLVLARCAPSERQEVPSLQQQWSRMREQHKESMSFAFFDPDLGLWMGSTPEHLLQWEKGQGRILAMAGTLKTGESWSAKEQLEQSVTGRFIQEILQSLGVDFAVDAVNEAQYGELRHLRNEYRFELPQSRLAELLERLNPTPAVAGYPQSAALRALEEHIPFERGAYAGVLGAWKDQCLQAWVQLRCARFSQKGTWLYAGAGINAGSDAQKEWDETQSKIQSIGL
jgi:isochorismate synthase